MSFSESLFSEKAQSFVKSGGCSVKSVMFSCLLKGSYEELLSSIEAYLETVKSILTVDSVENLDIYKGVTMYACVQMMSLEECGGLPEANCGEFVNSYICEINKASSVDVIDELFRKLVLGYYEILIKERKETSYSPQVQACCSFVRKNIREKLSIQAISEQLHFSKSYIAHKFKSETGITIRQFIIAERIREAELMIQCNLPIAMIAQELRFSSQSHFAATFKKHTGKTPNQFKKQVRII